MAVYPTGGILGQLLQKLVENEGIPGLTISISEETRENITVLETASGQQYRFILPGPTLSEREWNACLDTLASLNHRSRFVVASGSLPPGVPLDFYRRVALVTKQAGGKVVIDASGPALRAALEVGVYLVKPSLRELEDFMGSTLESQSDQIAACRNLIGDDRAEIVVLTLGDQGALLVTHGRALRARALPVEPVNVVGAGDSFLGAMVWSLRSSHGIETAFRYGVAAGSATLLMPGTELCRQEDVERLVKEVWVDEFEA